MKQQGETTVRPVCPLSLARLKHTSSVPLIFLDDEIKSHELTKKELDQEKKGLEAIRTIFVMLAEVTNIMDKIIPFLVKTDTETDQLRVNVIRECREIMRRCESLGRQCGINLPTSS